MSPAEQDKRWIAMILEGGHRENKAFKEIYDTYSKMVISFITKEQRGSREDAEDALQDVFMEFIMDIHDKKFRAESSIKNYLMTIVRNKWMNRIEKQAVRDKYVETTKHKEKDSPFPNAELPKELELIRDERLRALLKTLSKLASKCMPTLKMFYWYEWPFVKIAELLKFPSEASVKMKKKRCMEEMRRYLDSHPHLKEFLRMK